MEESHRRLFERKYFEWEQQFKKTEVVLKDMTLFELLSAFKTVLDNVPKETVHDIGAVGITIEEQIDFLMTQLEKKERIVFSSIMQQLEERLAIIVTFMAILELIRTHRIIIQQAGVFGEIYILKRGG